MAAEVVFVGCVTEVLRKLNSVLDQEIRLAKGVTEELKKLHDTLEVILAVTADAEKKQIKETVVRLWLRRLKDVVYDADDLLEEFSYQLRTHRREMDSVKYKTLILCNCPFLQKLPRDMGSLKNLRHLDLTLTGIEVLPKSISSLYNLQTLNLSFCTYLEGIPKDIGALKHLMCLDISNTKIRELPNSITCLYNLRTLKLDSCPNLEALPRDIGALKTVRYLDISRTNIKVLPESSTSGFSDLEILKLGRCKEATTIAFPSLIELTIDNMLNLEEWVAPPPLHPAAFSKFSSSFPYLTKISIIRCHKLTITPTLFPSLKELMVNCGNGKVVNSVVRSNLTSLISLDIFYAPELMFLPEGLLQNNNLLQSLRISDCPKFRGFCSDEDDDKEEGISSHLHRSSLQSLELFDCPVLQFLPDVRGFTSLQKLTIQNCNELKSLPDDLEFISSIEDLDVDNFEKEPSSPPSN
ncbi:hypothetical protein BVC80_7163g1 [Macleaya cordata]|uniref:Disease resistance N-terminal domain-containing protein n=1 Tax=Macleaya cordata TaxID=56857 RepID=A0A200QN33_MACCD|nr:hypothetical protein BVC80_7163g1 [Macleaya cordata]